MAHSLDELVANQIQEHQLPGLSLAVVRESKLAKAQAYGVAGVGNSAPVTPDTVFQAGSLSKCLTAVAALRLVDRGQLCLEEPLDTYLRSWTIPPHEWKGHPLTLRRLLSHEAGFSIHGFRGYAVGQPLPSLLQILQGQPPANNSPIRVVSAPGTAPRYSGGGYTVLQQLLIDVTGLPFPELLDTLVLRPLGMSASTFEQPLPAGWGRSAASGSCQGVPIAGGAHVYPEMAAAGLWTTASDLARFIIGLQCSLAGQAGPLLSTGLARETLRANSAGYGLGFSIGRSPQGLQFFHSGRNAGFDALLLGTAETGRGVVLLANANVPAEGLNVLLKAAVREYF